MLSCKLSGHNFSQWHDTPCGVIAGRIEVVTWYSPTSSCTKCGYHDPGRDEMVEEWWEEHFPNPDYASMRQDGELLAAICTGEGLFDDLPTA